MAIAKLRGAKVLLVEDNEINQELALDLLISNGLRVEVANDGQEALNLLEQKDYDGVLMDCQMPVMDGYEATRRIRAQERFKELPVLAGLMELRQNDVSNSSSNDTLDLEKFKELLFQLREMLEDDDTDSSEFIEELEELPGIDIHRSILKRLSKSIAEYKFEQALEELNKLEADND